MQTTEFPEVKMTGATKIDEITEDYTVLSDAIITGLTNCISFNFEWKKFPDRQPALNSPDPSYHGAVWTEGSRTQDYSLWPTAQRPGCSLVVVLRYRAKPTPGGMLCNRSPLSATVGKRAKGTLLTTT